MRCTRVISGDGRRHECNAGTLLLNSQRISLLIDFKGSKSVEEEEESFSEEQSIVTV